MVVSPPSRQLPMQCPKDAKQLLLQAVQLPQVERVQLFDGGQGDILFLVVVTNQFQFTAPSQIVG